MINAPSEEDVRTLLQVHQQYQAEADSIIRQLGLIQFSIEGCDKAISTIEGMKSADDGQEMLVPIGEGSFVRAALTSREKVILGVGAGVCIEKTVSEAKEAMSMRKDQLVAGSNKLNEALKRIDVEMGKVQTALAKYEKQAAAGSERLV